MRSAQRFMRPDGPAVRYCVSFSFINLPAAPAPPHSGSRSLQARSRALSRALISGEAFQPPGGRGCPPAPGRKPAGPRRGQVLTEPLGIGEKHVPREWGRLVHPECEGHGPLGQRPLCASVSSEGHLAHHPFLREDTVVREAGGTGPC